MSKCPPFATLLDPPPSRTTVVGQNLQSVRRVDRQRGDLSGRFAVRRGRHARQTSLKTGRFLLRSLPDPDQTGTAVVGSRGFRGRLFRRALRRFVQVFRVNRDLERLSSTAKKKKKQRNDAIIKPSRNPYIHIQPGSC